VRSEIGLAANWIDGRTLDRALIRDVSPHAREVDHVLIRVAANSSVMVDAAVRLLSLLNQLAASGKRVVLEFEKMDGAMGYLNRLRFFEFLSADVIVKPRRPAVSMGALRRGQSAGLVELVRINHGARAKRLPTQLAERLGDACSGRTDEKELTDAVFTVFSEIIDNVYSHVYEEHHNELDGFVALQVYKNGNTAKVVVSDSGKGILHTLRPTLTDAKLKRLSDTELVVEIFRQGISRHGKGRGCGLKASADSAIKYKTQLDVRLPDCTVHLRPARGIYEANTAYCQEGLALLWGTHLCFDFRLGN
jgi:hypothetical protein